MPHEPERMCAACRQRAAKSALLRVVESNAQPVLDVRHKMPGRGVYLCRNAQCISKAAKGRALQRMLSVPVPETFYEELKNSLNG